MDDRNEREYVNSLARLLDVVNAAFLEAARNLALSDVRPGCYTDGLREAKHRIEEVSPKQFGQKISMIKEYRQVGFRQNECKAQLAELEQEIVVLNNRLLELEQEIIALEGQLFELS